MRPVTGADGVEDVDASAAGASSAFTGAQITLSTIASACADRLMAARPAAIAKILSVFFISGYLCYFDSL